jgi:hypothetical protein
MNQYQFNFVNEIEDLARPLITGPNEELEKAFQALREENKRFRQRILDLEGELHNEKLKNLDSRESEFVP